MEGTRELFARHSLRCTRQRMAVYEMLRSCRSHPTAEELFRIVKPEVGQLSLATVYNALEALCNARLVRKLPTTNGCCRFDADTSPHSHVRFRDTAEICDVPPEYNDRLVGHIPPDLLAEIERSLGIEIDGVSVQLIASRRNGDGTDGPPDAAGGDRPR